METIRIDLGVYTPLEIDLREFDFTGIEKVVLCIKNILQRSMLFEYEFSTAEVHRLQITPEQSKLLREDAEYDFKIVTLDGKCYKNGDNGKIILRKGCGECSELH